MTTVDPHHHFWRQDVAREFWRDPEHHALVRDFQSGELGAWLRAAGVDRTVLVQSVNTPQENDRLLHHARTVDFVAGVVAWLPLSDPDTAGPMLAALRDEPAVRGVRCLVGRTDLDWLASPAVCELLAEVAAAGWVWDVVPVTAGQVRAVLGAVERVPGLRVVVDHLGRPPVEVAGWQPWATLLAELAAAPAVALKVSVGVDVLTVWPAWDPDQLRRYVDHAAAVFGPDRLMLASNWPVITLRTGYAQAWRDLESALRRSGIDAAGLAAVRGGTASHWYGLRPRGVEAPGRGT
jgi:L-fuconolactonase